MKENKLLICTVIFSYIGLLDLNKSDFHCLDVMEAMIAVTLIVWLVLRLIHSFTNDNKV